MVIFIVLSIVIIILILQCRLTIGFSFSMDNLVCSSSVIIYFCGTTLKKINLFPGENGKGKKAKKVRKKRDIYQMRTIFRILLKLIRKSLILKNFKLYVMEGTGDACNTAIIYGLLWNLVPLLTGLFKNCSVKNTDIKIEAEYNRKIWKLNFNCIFSIKIANIIHMCTKLLIFYLKNRKGGDADAKSSNRRFNDYSHAKY